MTGVTRRGNFAKYETRGVELYVHIEYDTGLKRERVAEEYVNAMDGPPPLALGTLIQLTFGPSDVDQDRVELIRVV